MNGRVVRLASKQMSVPVSVAGSVVGALGINQSLATTDSAASRAASVRTLASRRGVFPPAPAAFITATPCGRYYGQQQTTVRPPFGHGYPRTVPDQVCGYKPGQLRSAYNAGKTSTGKGVTVAVVDAYGSATIRGDATRYFARNDPGNPFRKAHFRQLLATPFQNESLCDASSWLVEQAIDVDHANTYVPGARGFNRQFRELTYEGVITYCDETGNCATRPNTLSTAPGYDSMTGLGSIGPSFVTGLARP